MRLKSLTPLAFGKFHKIEPFSFSKGLNIVLGDNEAGKSTLAAFVSGMFYGFKKEGRIRISRTPEFERYRPWSGKDYRGTLVFEDQGILYRLERSFDPDAIRLFRHDTGEDITGLYTQDTRKEYDIAKRHLGLSQVEFENTVWIGQLQSPQEPDLQKEIQDKLESIVQGGAEDVPLAKALAVLWEERSQIKTQRSTKARLDLISARVSELERELCLSQDKEAEIRSMLIEALELKKQKAALTQEVNTKEKKLNAWRYAFLKETVSRLSSIKDEIEAIEKRIRDTSWAQQIPEKGKEDFQDIKRRSEIQSSICDDVEKRILALREKEKVVANDLKDYEDIIALGLSETKIAALYSTYVSSKAAVTRGQRSANEVRRSLSALEENLKEKGLYGAHFQKSLLKDAEEHKETCLLAEREESRLQVELERAKALAFSQNPGGATGWIYGLALGILGGAIVLTLMGLPFGLPAFAIAVGLFVVGLLRHRKAFALRAALRDEVEKWEHELSEQKERVESANSIFQEFLSAAHVKDVEELREKAREIGDAEENLRILTDRYSMSHDVWFKASEELSSVEAEFRALLQEAGVLSLGEVITDQAVDEAILKVRNATDLKRTLNEIQEDIEANENDLEAHLQHVRQIEDEKARLFEASKVLGEEEFFLKLEANEQYSKAKKALDEAREKEETTLQGRSARDIIQELQKLEEIVDPSSVKVGSENRYPEERDALSRVKDELFRVGSKLAVLERGISMTGSQSRGSGEVSSELDRVKALEEELILDKEALDLAYNVLQELSKIIHREFAPALNSRVGEVLQEITEDRYSDAHVSPDLEITVMHPDTGFKTKAESLSGGTLDQCYFALRIATAELVTKDSSFPMFLDDSFVQYDDGRLSGALKVLSALSKRHQIILFSCHGREERLAKKMGLQYNLIQL